MTEAVGVIRQLDESLANQIAAGEVVERPASVVKELVENAIDARATRITIATVDGGLESIEVTDNGVGLPGDQVALAFSRHATSKIQTVDDLFAINTLGFRGEALPSIASVSHVTMRTKTAHARAGTEIRIEGGHHKTLQPCGTPVGTTITVTRLFYNTPARRKFLKTPTGEQRAITEMITKFALAQPHIQFTYEVNGRMRLQTTGDGELRSAASAVYGATEAAALLPVYREEPFGSVSGYIAPPTMAKGTRQHISLFVNGRAVVNRRLTVAIERGYAGLLMTGRFPVAIIQLTIDPSLIDVNVHPAKTEVRLRNDDAAFSAVLHGVREALLAANLFSGGVRGTTMPTADKPLSPPLPPRKTPPEQTHVAIEWRHGDADRSPAVGHTSRQETAAAAIAQPTTSAPPRYEVVDETTGEVKERRPKARHWEQTPRAVNVDHVLPHGPGTAEEARVALREARIMGQVLQTYIAAAVPWGLWLIDQHAAHERILYETVLSQEENNVSQQLLIPVQVQLPADTLAAVEECESLLQTMGFALEPFGGTAIIVRAVPADLAQSKETVEGILEEVASLHVEGKLEQRRERLAAMIACKAAVKAGDALPNNVLADLLRRLAATQNPFACPHGRPIVIDINQHELERRFGRR